MCCNSNGSRWTERKRQSTLHSCQNVCRSATFDLSTRNAREWVKRGREPVCGFCRWPHKALTDTERERYRRWWLEESGLSARELYEIAVGLGASFMLM